MRYTENHKQQLYSFIKEGLVRTIAFFEKTLGLPHEITIEKMREMKTLGEQLDFLDAIFRKYPNIFKDMKHFTP